MTKLSLFGTSFVAAIPGVGLGYLMLMVVLNNFDTIPMLLKVVTILAFTMSLMMAIFPLGILIWHGGRGKTVQSKGNAKAAVAAGAATVAASGVVASDVFEDADDEIVDLNDEVVNESGEVFDVDDEFEGDHDAFESFDSLRPDFAKTGKMTKQDDLDGFEADGGLDDEFEFNDFDEEEEF